MITERVLDDMENMHIDQKRETGLPDSGKSERYGPEGSPVIFPTRPREGPSMWASAAATVHRDS